MGDIDYQTAKIENVTQPKLAQTIVKLREVYVDVINEGNRGIDDLASTNDHLIDKFLAAYNNMQDIIVKIMSKNIIAEVDAVLPTSIFVK